MPSNKIKDNQEAFLHGNGYQTGKSTLIERCKQGDNDSFKKLFEIFKNRVFSLSVRMLGNELDAEDAAQDIFIKIFSKIHQFKGRSTLETWIYRIAVNTCLDKLKTLKNYEEIGMESLSREPLATISQDKMQSTASFIIDNEISSLPEGYKTVFILYAIEGFKHDEIAAILGISPGTSKSQLSGAKSILRKKLAPHREALTNEL